jgi:hypothetical protein
VSPQYQCKYDDFFETLYPSADSNSLPIELQVRAGFAPDPISGCYPKFWRSESLPVPAPPRGTTNTGPALNSQRTPPIALVPGANEGDIDPFPTHDANKANWENNNDDPSDTFNDSPHNQGPPNQLSPVTVPPWAPWNPPVNTPCSGHISRPGPKDAESIQQLDTGIIIWQTSVEIDIPEEDYEAFALETYLIEKKMQDPITLAATHDMDTPYYNQAMQVSDKKEFCTAMEKEVQDHEGDREHWTMFAKKNIPYGTHILQSVWTFKCKRRIDMREEYERKARLVAQGGQQVHCVNYWETYALVVSWTSIRFFLIISLLSGWHTQQIDFVLAFPQAKVECDIFIEAPLGFNFKPGSSKKTHCLKLLINLYGTKQGAKLW